MNVTRVKKQLILYLPYILIGLMATKLGESWRFSPGVEIGEKLRNIMTGAGMAFQSPLPSFQPLDLLIGILCGALVRVYVVTKGKNAKKYRKNIEYGSARWGKPCVIRDKRIGLLIDIRTAVDSGKGPGFEYWAKKENLKRAAKSVRMLEARGVLNSTDIAAVIANAQQSEAISLDQCHEIDEQIQNLRELRQHMFDYSRTRKVAEAYRASGYSKQYAAEHKDELRCYREAKKAFDRLGQNRLLKVAELQEREHELIVEKQKRYTAYRQKKAESKQLQEAQANVERILNHQILITPQEQAVADNRDAKNL